jgi:hypothetical protein
MEIALRSPYNKLCLFLDANPSILATKEGRRVLIDAARQADDKGELTDANFEVIHSQTLSLQHLCSDDRLLREFHFRTGSARSRIAQLLTSRNLRIPITRSDGSANLRPPWITLDPASMSQTMTSTGTGPGPIRPTRRVKKETEGPKKLNLSPVARKRPANPAIKPVVRRTNVVRKPSKKAEDEEKIEEEEVDTSSDEDEDDGSTDSGDEDSNEGAEDAIAPVESYQLWGLLVKDNDSNFPTIVSAFDTKEAALLGLVEGTFQHHQAYPEGKRYLRLAASPFWTQKDVSVSEIHDASQESVAGVFLLSDVPPKVWKLFCADASGDAELRLKRAAFAKRCGCLVDV